MKAAATDGWVAIRTSDAEAAFERLFANEYVRVVGIANRILSDCYEAEDVAQEVFCALHRRHPADAPFAAAWVHAAAAHAALNVIRGKRRRAARERNEAAAQYRLGEADEAALDPLVETVRNEDRATVRGALSRISPKSAAVLALRYSGLSYAETAAALGVRVDQVGTLLRRAEASLRKEIHHEASR